MTLSPLTSLVVRGRAADLARRLEAAPESEPLVAALLTAGEQLAADVVPRGQFRDDLRTRLMAVAAVQAGPAESAPVANPSAVSWRVPSRARGVAAGAMAAVVVVTGIAVAGSRSLPGDPFYGVKRQVEGFSLRTADGDVARGTRHLDQATTRLREVGGLVLGRDQLAGPAPSALGFRLVAASSPTAAMPLGAPVAERVRQTLGDMDTATLRGQELLEAVFRSTGERGPLQVMGRWANEQGNGIERLLPALPPASREQALTSLALVVGVAADADELLGTSDCAPGCDPTGGAPSSGAPGSVPSGGTATSPGGTTGPTTEPRPSGPATSGPATTGRPAQGPGQSVLEPGQRGQGPGASDPGPGQPVPGGSGEPPAVPRTGTPGAPGTLLPTPVPVAPPGSPPISSSPPPPQPTPARPSSLPRPVIPLRPSSLPRPVIPLRPSSLRPSPLPRPVIPLRPPSLRPSSLVGVPGWGGGTGRDHPSSSATGELP